MPYSEISGIQVPDTWPMGEIMVADLHWTDVYTNLARETFGIPLPSDFRAHKINSCYPPESAWFAKAYAALFAIELEYIESLLPEIKTQNVPGVFAEFGIFQGAWINRLHEMTERAGLGDRQIWGFDSFAGLSRPHPFAASQFRNAGI